MSKKLMSDKQIFFLGLLLIGGTLFAEEIRLPIKTDSIEISSPGYMRSAIDVGFITDASNDSLTGIMCGRGKGQVMVMVFGQELNLYMEDEICVQQLRNALDKIKNEGALGLKITSKNKKNIESIQPYFSHEK